MQKKRSANSRTDHLKLSSQSYKKKKQLKRINKAHSTYGTPSKKTNIHIIGFIEGTEKEKVLKILFKEIMTENFTN